MPLKWKLFIAFNLVLGLGALILLLWLLYSIPYTHVTGTGAAIAYTFLASLFIVSFNSLHNVYLVQRFFPNKNVPPALRGFNLLMIILNIIIAICFLALLAYAWYDTYYNPDITRDKNTAENAFISILIGQLLYLYILIRQVQLNKLLRKNQRDKIDALIDEIGQ